MNSIFKASFLLFLISCSPQLQMERNYDFKLDSNGCIELDSFVNIELYKSRSVQEIMQSTVIKDGFRDGFYFQLQCHLKEITPTKDQRISQFLEILLEQKKDEIGRFHSILIHLKNLKKLRSANSFHLFLSLAESDFYKDYGDILVPTISQLGFKLLEGQIKTINGQEFYNYLNPKVLWIEDDEARCYKARNWLW